MTKKGGGTNKHKTKRQPRRQPQPRRHVLRRIAIGLMAVAVALAAGVGNYMLYINRPAVVPPLPFPPLKQVAAARGVELGMLAQPSQLNAKPFGQILTGQYSMLTSDGQIHWDKFRPTPTSFDFAPMDKEVAFAQAHGMTVQAHHLVWDEEDSLPKWLKEGHFSKEQLLDILHDHITQTVGRYKGKVQEWSVINEAFTRQQHIFNQTAWWGDRIGSLEYVDEAFRWAHEADPHAKLILNDYFNETQTSVSDAMYNYLKGAKARGVPIDGVGIQMHIDSTYPRSVNDMTRNMQRFGALGYKVYVTEFDMRSNKPLADKAAQMQREADLTRDVVHACVDAGNCVSFTVFGMRNQPAFDTWLTRARPRSYLLDERYQPKPSYDAFWWAWLK